MSTTWLILLVRETRNLQFYRIFLSTILFTTHDTQAAKWGVTFASQRLTAQFRVTSRLRQEARKQEGDVNSWLACDLSFPNNHWMETMAISECCGERGEAWCCPFNCNWGGLTISSLPLTPSTFIWFVPNLSPERSAWSNIHFRSHRSSDVILYWLIPWDKSTNIYTRAPLRYQK
jgi:hypothetical protein